MHRRGSLCSRRLGTGCGRTDSSGHSKHWPDDRDAPVGGGRTASACGAAARRASASPREVAQRSDASSAAPAPTRNPEASLGGTDKKHLYHNSTLALDANLGAIVCYSPAPERLLEPQSPFRAHPCRHGDGPDPTAVSWIKPRLAPGEPQRHDSWLLPAYLGM